MPRCIGGIFYGLTMEIPRIGYLLLICLRVGTGIHNGLRNRGESMRVQIPPQVLCAYIRIGIGAALRMQSGNRWEFKSPYAH